MNKRPVTFSQEEEVRKGPWTLEEDLILVNYIANHGEGVWNSLAKAAGLKRTGKSCRLRWLNYLRPDVRRGNITLEEQLLIIELQAKWGNRWSKIAKHLPGRTDNEIKNFWRTRIQKHIKQAERCRTSNNANSSYCGSVGLDTTTLPVNAGSQILTNTVDPTVFYTPMQLPPFQEAMVPAAMRSTNVMTPTPQLSVPVEQNEDHYLQFSGGNHWNAEDLWSMQPFNVVDHI